MVANKLDGPTKLTVTITPDAENILTAHPQLKQKLEAAKPPEISHSGPSMR